VPHTQTCGRTTGAPRRKPAAMRTVWFSIFRPTLDWIFNFLTGRTQAVSLDGKLSNWLPITQSIVQDSGIGPIWYIIFASDLKLRSTMSLLCKYADDTTLMIPQNTDVCQEDEFKYVVQWSVQNKLIINLTKTKEMVFHRPGPCRFIAPRPLVDIKHVATFKLLGVYIASTLSMETHVNYVLSLVNQRLYLMNQLMKTGLSAEACEVIFHSLTVSRLLYALPAFAGFCLVLTLLVSMPYFANRLDGES
jgi:Reverse transcriptase (RNA-dependent DNA polymerase)